MTVRKGGRSFVVLFTTHWKGAGLIHYQGIYYYIPGSAGFRLSFYSCTLNCLCVCLTACSTPIVRPPALIILPSLQRYMYQYVSMFYSIVTKPQLLTRTEWEFPFVIYRSQQIRNHIIITNRTRVTFAYTQSLGNTAVVCRTAVVIAGGHTR